MDVREIGEIAEIREMWIELLNHSKTGTVFQHPVFLEAWWKQFKTDKTRRQLLAAYADGELVGVGVFEAEGNIVRFLGMREVLGKDELTDYGDIVVKQGVEEEVWRGLLKHMNYELPIRQAQGGRIRSYEFDYVREDSPSFEVLPTVAEELNLAIDLQKQEVAPLLTLPASWEGYVNRLERKKRHELRRKIRRFEEGQTATFKVLDQAGEAERTAFVELVRGSSEEKRAFMSEEMATFFGKLMENSMTEKFGLLAFLEVGTKQLGAVFLLKEGKKLLGYNGGAPTLAGQTVGVVMTAKVIEWAIEHEFTELDFLRGGERYKYDLGAQDRQLWQVRLESH